MWALVVRGEASAPGSRGESRKAACVHETGRIPCLSYLLRLGETENGVGTGVGEMQKGGDGDSGVANGAG